MFLGSCFLVKCMLRKFSVYFLGLNGRTQAVLNKLKSSKEILSVDVSQVMPHTCINFLIICFFSWQPFILSIHSVLLSIHSILNTYYKQSTVVGTERRCEYDPSQIWLIETDKKLWYYQSNLIATCDKCYKGDL